MQAKDVVACCSRPQPLALFVNCWLIPSNPFTQTTTSPLRHRTGWIGSVGRRFSVGVWVVFSPKKILFTLLELLLLYSACVLLCLKHCATFTFVLRCKFCQHADTHTHCCAPVLLLGLAWVTKGRGGRSAYSSESAVRKQQARDTALSLTKYLLLFGRVPLHFLSTFNSHFFRVSESLHCLTYRVLVWGVRRVCIISELSCMLQFLDTIHGSICSRKKISHAHKWRLSWCLWSSATMQRYYIGRQDAVSHAIVFHAM